VGYRVARILLDARCAGSDLKILILILGTVLCRASPSTPHREQERSEKNQYLQHELPFNL
jgi:hypothetical protein